MPLYRIIYFGNYARVSTTFFDRCPPAPVAKANLHLTMRVEWWNAAARSFRQYGRARIRHAASLYYCYWMGTRGLNCFMDKKVAKCLRCRWIQHVEVCIYELVRY